MFTVENPKPDLELILNNKHNPLFLLISFIFISHKQNAIEYSGCFSNDNDYVTTTVKGNPMTNFNFNSKRKVSEFLHGITAFLRRIFIS